jgi:hypothetical protein
VRHHRQPRRTDHTAHHIADENTDREQLPDRVQRLLDRRANAVAIRRNPYQAWCRQASDWALDRQLSRDKQLSRSRDRSLEHGLDL